MSSGVSHGSIRFLALATLSFSLGAWAAAAPSIPEIRRLVSEVKYEEAMRSLEKLRAVEGHSLTTTLALLEYEGIIAGALKQPDRARTAFKKLLALKPTAQLSPDYAPRITTPFFEAKGWLTSHAPLSFSRAAPTLENGNVTSVAVTVKYDSFSLARKVRLFVQQPDLSFKTVERPASSEVRVQGLSAPQVQWGAQLIGERDAVIAELGSSVAPLVEAANIEALPPPTEVENHAVREPTAALRISGVVAAGLSLAAFTTASVFGVRSAKARATFDKASTGVDLITSLTRAEALRLDRDARWQAVAANVLFSVGATLLISGAVLWLLGASSAPGEEPSP